MQYHEKLVIPREIPRNGEAPGRGAKSQLRRSRSRWVGPRHLEVAAAQVSDPHEAYPDSHLGDHHLSPTRTCQFQVCLLLSRSQSRELRCRVRARVLPHWLLMEGERSLVVIHLIVQPLYIVDLIQKHDTWFWLATAVYRVAIVFASVFFYSSTRSVDQIDTTTYSSVTVRAFIIFVFLRCVSPLPFQRPRLLLLVVRKVLQRRCLLSC